MPKKTVTQKTKVISSYSKPAGQGGTKKSKPKKY